MSLSQSPMDTSEEVVISLGVKDQTQNHIVKGKRTKRVRPQSPLAISKTEEYQFLGEDINNAKNSPTTPTSSEEFEQNNNNNNININNNNINNNIYSSSSTEEEEDMANCLILLAQGQSRESPRPAKEEGYMTMTTTMMTTMKPSYNNNYSYNNSSSSRKFMETSSMGAKKAGFYVYECKTCNKTFPSFQALGGHRASHKKPKASSPLAAILEKEKKKEQDFMLRKNNNNVINHSSLSFQFLSSGSSNNNMNTKNKVHECSICGAEFASGQALGGHMRRHRAPNAAIATTSNANSSSLLALNNNQMMGLEADQQYHKEDLHHQPRKKRNALSLDLDLNLPAPEDEHESDSSSFPFEHKKQKQQQHQQTSLVFSSSPAMVDCQY